MSNQATVLRILGVLLALTIGVQAVEGAEGAGREGVEGEGGRGPKAAWKRFWRSSVGGVEWVVGGAGETFLGLVGKGGKGGKGEGARPEASRDLKIEATLVVEGSGVSLGKDRQLRAVVRLSNRGGRTQALQFPTTQRVEAVLRNSQGRIVARAFEDQRWLDEEGIVTINPKERVEFELSLPTRELAVGEAYVLEASVVNQVRLKAQTEVRVRP
jgi:hypothetical protein